MSARRFLAPLAAVLVALAGCDGGTEWEPVRLDQSQTTAYLNIGKTQVHVTGGSGDYSAVVSEPAVASASFEYGTDVELGAVTYLVIEPKAVGTAIVTVIDRKSGGVVLLGLTVEKRQVNYRISNVVTNIDADTPEVIEADMAATAHLSEGDGFEFKIAGSHMEEGAEGTFVFSDAAGDETLSGGFTLGTDFTERPSAFEPLWPKGVQIHSNRFRWMMTAGDDEWEYYTIVVSGQYSRVNIVNQHTRIYEDFTEHYKAKFPDAGVRSVARMLVVNQ